MKKHRISGPAIFMYSVIIICVICFCLCFGLYYGGATGSKAVLWCGIVSFMIVYHFWLRLIMGNVTKLFRININCRWFRERKFESKLYKILRVKKWKGKALTYNPELFSLKDCSMEDIVKAMTKAETDHWINELISLFSILFFFIWGYPFLFITTAIIAMLFDAQFIVIQRYNRPRMLKIIEKNRRKRQNLQDD